MSYTETMYCTSDVYTVSPPGLLQYTIYENSPSVYEDALLLVQCYPCRLSQPYCGVFNALGRLGIQPSNVKRSILKI